MAVIRTCGHKFLLRSCPDCLAEITENGRKSGRRGSDLSDREITYLYRIEELERLLSEALNQ